MPSKKKKYNARFPAGRIKKIMQSDEEIGKVAQAVPVIISRTLELFVESLLTKTLKITNSRNAKTLSPSHMKQCIMAENRFDFLRELVKNIPDISVAEEVSNDSSPEVTIDQSDTPYDLSMPSSSNSNEIITQKSMPSNGIISVIRNNGVTRSCGTTIVSSPLQSPDITLNLSTSDESRANLKRQWDAISRFHSEIHTKAATLESNSNKTLSTESSPPKLYRTDSAPASLRTTQQLTKPTTVTPTPTQSSQQQHHQQQPNQVLPTDLRRLRHQNKSVPGNICTETVTSQKLINNTSTNNNNNSNSNNSKPQTPTTAIPAPIVSIDFCNKPIVKIDYSNLALHDTNYSESPSSSSSSPTAEQTNRSATCIAKTPLQSPTATPTVAAAATAATTTTAAAAAAVTVATTAVDSPVINIDLSNIVTSGKFTTSSLNPSVISPNCVGVPLPSALTSTVATNKNSYLELDEDYDNI